MDIKSLTDYAMELLRGMVKIPSPSFGEAAVCDYISSHLHGLGIRHERIGNNIVTMNKGYKPEMETLMLCAHIDTVPAAGEYRLDPFKPDYQKVKELFGWDEEEVVYGLGSNDDGGSVVAMLAAFRCFYEAELDYNLMLVLSCEEERSGPGGMTKIWELVTANDGTGLASAKAGLASAKAGLASAKEKKERCPYEIGLAKPDFAIIGEPTGMRAATSERGLLVIDGEAVGVAGHAAREEGVNALYIALDDIARLREHEFSKVSPTMGRVKLTVTQINAGTAHNVVPDKCSFVVDIRPTEQYDNQEILTELQAICRSNLRARNLKNKSSATAPGSPLLALLEELGVERFSSPTTSDWIRVGCDAVKIGPGDSARSHKKDEYILRAEVEEAIGLYIKILEKFNNIIQLPEKA